MSQIQRRYACHCFPNFWGKDEKNTEFGSSDLPSGALRMIEGMIRHPEAEACWYIDRTTGKVLHRVDKAEK